VVQPNVKKATKSPIDKLKEPERVGTVAVRYWQFRTGAATNISLDETVELVVARRNDPKQKPPKEILFHRGLLGIFQVGYRQVLSISKSLLSSVCPHHCLAYRGPSF
jgi:hypothetical protein